MQISNRLFPILLFLLLSMSACGDTPCPEPENRQEETTIIADYLVQPTIDQTINIRRSRRISFTNTSPCYVFHINQVAYKYIFPWASEPEVKVNKINIAVPPNQNIDLDMSVPIGAQILGVYSTRDGTKVTIQ